jgi:hypothetical protein
LLTYSFGVIKWSKTNLQNINIQTRVLFTKFCKHHPKSAIERFNLPRENGGRGFSNLEILQHNQIASLKNYFLNRARDNTFFNALVSADKGYTPLNLSDNIISDIVEPNIPDTIANIKQKSLHGRYFKELEQPEINIQASHAWLKKSNIHPETEGFIFAIQDRVMFNSLFTPRKQLQENTHGALARTKSGNKMHHLHRSLLQSLLNLFVETPQKSNSLQ